MKVIILITSLFLYFYAPMQYNYEFCCACFILGIIDVVLILKNDFKNFGFLNFNTIFLFSFMFVSFIFPVFVYPFSSMQGIMGLININVISKATALCLVALSCYCMFYSRAAHRYRRSLYLDLFRLPRANGTPRKIYTLSLFFLSLLLATNIVSSGWEEITSFPFIVELYEVALPFLLVCNCASYGKMTLNSFIRVNMYPLVSAAIICLIYIVLGDRGPVMICAMAILITFWMYVGRISLAKLLPLMFVAVLLMYALRITRGTDNSISNIGVSGFVNVASEGISGTGFIFLFSDLIFICRELYFGFERTMIHGLFYPERIFILPFTPFPFIPSLLSEIFIGIPYDKLHTGLELNSYMMSTFGEVTSFGIHCVIDIFMSWGIFGVLIFFSVFGHWMGKISYKKDCNLYYKMFFIVMISLALYTPRSFIYAMIRPMAYAAFFVWITFKNMKNLRNEKNCNS